MGSRIVGWADRHKGLAEYFLAQADNVLVLDGEALTPQRATVIQPLCTVLDGLERPGDVRGARVAVIGQGSIGTLFSHALNQRGAAHVTGVDPIDRRDVAAEFGVDECVWDTASRWAARLSDAERPDIVVEAVGHQGGTLDDAVQAVGHGGRVLGFGVPDEPYYAFPFARFFRKNATLFGGVTIHRRDALAASRDIWWRTPSCSTRTSPTCSRRRRRSRRSSSRPSCGGAVEGRLRRVAVAPAWLWQAPKASARVSAP